MVYDFRICKVTFSLKQDVGFRYQIQFVYCVLVLVCFFFSLLYCHIIYKILPSWFWGRHCFCLSVKTNEWYSPKPLCCGTFINVMYHLRRYSSVTKVYMHKSWIYQTDDNENLNKPRTKFILNNWQIYYDQAILSQVCLDERSFAAL